MDRATDERLAELAAQGDERAFAVLYARYGRRLHAYCRSIVNHDEDAHDALQSSMLKAYRALRGNGGAVHVRPWLFRIAHNESISVIRARRGHEALREDTWVTEDGPGARAETREELDEMVDGVLELSERRRTALVMREFSGFGYPAIAAALGTSAGAAKQAVFEARSALAARRRAAALLGPLAPLWSAFTGWLGAGVPSAAKAGALVVALAAGTGTAEELMSEKSVVRPPSAEAATVATPAIALAERAPAKATARSAPARDRTAPDRVAHRTAAASPAPRRAAPEGTPRPARAHDERSRPAPDRNPGAPTSPDDREMAGAPPQAPHPTASNPGGFRDAGSQRPDGGQRSGRSGYTSSMVARGR